MPEGAAKPEVEVEVDGRLRFANGWRRYHERMTAVYAGRDLVLRIQLLSCECVAHNTSCRM